MTGDSLVVTGLDIFIKQPINKGAQKMETITKSAFHKGKYIAHSNGTFPVRKTVNGWAVSLKEYNTEKWAHYEARTLKELDLKIRGKG